MFGKELLQPGLEHIMIFPEKNSGCESDVISGVLSLHTYSDRHNKVVCLSVCASHTEAVIDDFIIITVIIKLNLNESLLLTSFLLILFHLSSNIHISTF